MDNTLLNAFAPFLTAILTPTITEAVQILIEKIIKKQILREVKRRNTIFITTVAAIAITILTFITVYNSTDCAIKNLAWVPFDNDGLGSTITVNPVTGSNCAFQISFDLKKQGGYVATYKKLGADFLVWWIDGIEFSYSGMGNSNTIEFKLVDNNDTPYGTIWHHSTDTGDKILSWSIPYGELRGPNGKIFKRDDFVLDRMDFSFSSWPGDAPGPGNVAIKDIRVILSWQIWLIIFIPVFSVLGIGVAYSLRQKRIKKNTKRPTKRAQDRPRRAVRSPKVRTKI